jgi:hypothetical protein
MMSKRRGDGDGDGNVSVEGLGILRLVCERREAQQKAPSKAIAGTCFMLTRLRGRGQAI